MASHLERRAIWNEFLARAFERGGPLQATPARAPAADALLEPTGRPSSPDSPPPAPLTEHPAPAGSHRGVRMTRALDLEPREIDWLWAGRVPLGMMTMFAGDHKLGKSYVTLAMAAALSRGLPLPSSDRPNRPGSTILRLCWSLPRQLSVRDRPRRPGEPARAHDRQWEATSRPPRRAWPT